MERRSSNSAGFSTSVYKKRQWGKALYTAERPSDAMQRISNLSKPMPIAPGSTLASAPAPVIIPPPPAPVANTARGDIQSLLSGQTSAETKRAYRGDLKHFLAFINHPEALDDMASLPKALASVDRNTATAYRDFMMITEKRAASTVNRRLATISTIFKALCEEGYIAKNPFSWVKRPKLGNIGKTPAFTQEQAESIISQPDDSDMGKRDRILLLLLFFCGLRRSEVIKVESGDFYQSQGHTLLKVYGKGRGDKSDVVLVPDSVWEEVREYIKDRGEGLLFTAQSRNTTYNRSDRPLSASRVYLIFKQYCRMAGIDADVYSPHSTRATFITLCLKGGADVRQTAYAARHLDVSTTIRYDRQRLDIENHASRHLNISLTVDDESDGLSAQ